MNATDDLTGPCPLRLGRDTCGELEQSERREWWLNNGRGAYAAGTVSGSSTRYHGLLTAVLTPPLGRVLAKADATLLDGEEAWPLFTNRWASGALAPAGHVHIESFQLVGRLPLWRYAIGDLVMEHGLWLDDGRAQGTDRVRLAWRLAAGVGRDAGLRVALLANRRDHQVSEPGHIRPVIEADGDRLTMNLEGAVILGIRAQGGGLDAGPAWIEGFDLPLEREHGLEDRDHHLRLGHTLLELTPGSAGPGPWVGLSAEVGRAPVRRRGRGGAESRSPRTGRKGCRRGPGR